MINLKLYKKMQRKKFECQIKDKKRTTIQIKGFLKEMSSKVNKRRFFGLGLAPLS